MKKRQKINPKKVKSGGNLGISKVIVSGYKSINKKKEINISPLTILSGTNSSGKSSFIQPLLLMKQTLEEGFDPGAILLNGPLVKFTSIDQILHIDAKGKRDKHFSIGFQINNEDLCDITYLKDPNGLIIENAYYEIFNYSEKYKNSLIKVNLNKNSTTDDLKSIVPEYILSIFNKVDEKNLTFNVGRNRCFLNAKMSLDGGPINFFDFPNEAFQKALRNIIYLPGLRGNPERYYPTTAIDTNGHNSYLPGSFHKYVASLINQWQFKDKDKLAKLEHYLIKLGLTNKIRTKKINDTEVSINVGRGLIIEIEDEELVNIADVGLGVSQTLPVLVALVYAGPGQTVYIEQPEIHLHPRAQYQFAEVVSESVNRGVKVVIETHSSLIIKGIQTIVARKNIAKDKVILHWLHRDLETGETEVDSTALNSDGSFGEWPIDFDEIEINAEMNYLDAMEESLE